MRFFLLNLGQEARRSELSVSLVELNFQTVTEYLLLASCGESTFETQLQKQTSDSVNDRRCFHGKTKVYLTSTSIQN